MSHLGSPPPARNTAREHLRASVWTTLKAELDRWAEVGRIASFWWRDDDAVAPTQALESLLALSERHQVPLALAVIPQGAETGLADRLARSAAPVTVLQHGFAHRNHAPSGEKSAELGDHRAVAAVAAELADGRDRLAALFADRFFPAMVPPWNRIGAGVEAALPDLGFSGLSTFGPRPAAGLGYLNTHIDIVDWRGNRGFAGEEACLGAAIGHLSARRTGRCDPDEPTGLLTHHLVHDAACWQFIDRFLAELQGHPAAVWVTTADALAGVGA